MQVPDDVAPRVTADLLVAQVLEHAGTVDELERPQLEFASLHIATPMACDTAHDLGVLNLPALPRARVVEDARRDEPRFGFSRAQRRLETALGFAHQHGVR
jgi:hypothetical protein